ncbi:thioesterase family protein [Aliikangiella maris]|uniref:Thioesterase family protein n=2 Tax=Aliikangiella maris TaxID=3162458 RepID=A0ABV3MRY8_9GAMM
MNDEQLTDFSEKELIRFGQLTERLAHVFYHKVPFHQLIGFNFDQITREACRISFTKKPELVGNFVHGILHGGVTATALDVVGGTMAAAAMLSKNLQTNDEEVGRKLAKVSTIDLRVDYLRPGRGEHFYANARLLRSGNKVAVVRMELHGKDDVLIALGTGTYLTG